MIYEYEACILNYMHELEPLLKEATYAKERDFFNTFAQVTKYPAFLYYREPTKWEVPFTHKFLSAENKQASFVPFYQTYIGRVYFENQGQIMDFASTLRFHWNVNSYLKVPWNDTTLKVGLRLLYIKIDEDRNGVDKKGAQRFVEFSWQSRLFMDDISTSNLVEEVRIFVTENGTKVLGDNNLIAIIK